MRKQVRRLPWQKWAKTKLGVDNYQLMRHDADLIQNAVCSAMARDGITLEEATEVARHALAEAKGPVYVVRAFEPKKLGEWLRRLEVEPLAEDTLPLPGAPAAQAGNAKLTKRAKGAAAEPDEDDVAKPVCRSRGRRAGVRRRGCRWRRRRLRRTVGYGSNAGFRGRRRGSRLRRRRPC